MGELETLIKKRIRREGPITFEAFMEEALYRPGLGYYASEDTEIGRSGDFYTSPHLHPVFGAMLGRQVEEMWQQMGEPAHFTIVETGPGRGWLARDMLDYLKNKDVYGRLSYVLAELNPVLKERQGELLGEHTAKIEWAEGLGDINSVSGVVLSNELMDALPVHMVEMKDRLKEIYISLDGEGKLVEASGPPSTPALSEYFAEFGISLPEGYRTEVNLRMHGWLREAASALKEGFLLTIDYGYPASELYAPERNRGTLMCYHKHQVNEDPLINIGRQDITAHVNFSALKRWGEEFGLTSIGFARQGPYLVSLGMDEVIEELYGGSPDFGHAIAGVKGLVMPGGMGDSHKVLIQFKGNGTPSLRGFTLKNRAGSL